jgi:hypothetical protein
MNILKALAGWALVLWALLDAFEQVILPRNEVRAFRISSLVLRVTWGPWKGLAGRMRSEERRTAFLGYYGPLSVLIMLAFWDLALIFGFALGWSGLRKGSFVQRLYLSGSNFFTLGLSNPPVTDVDRIVTLIEAGVGLAFLAVIIGYLPVYYGASSSREALIPRFQGLAGYPSTAGGLVRRSTQVGDKSLVFQVLMELQGWAADVLQSHRAYKLVALYRSQKGNESWVAVLTTILDATALWITLPREGPQLASPVTFDVARRVAQDLAGAFRLRPESLPADRLPRPDFQQLCEKLSAAGMELSDSEETEQKLAQLRGTYEPYVYALSQFLFVELPAWIEDAA